VDRRSHKTSQAGGSFFLYNLPKWNLRLGDFLASRLTFRHWVAINMTYRLPIQGRLYPSITRSCISSKAQSPPSSIQTACP